MRHIIPITILFASALISTQASADPKGLECNDDYSYCEVLDPADNDKMADICEPIAEINEILFVDCYDLTVPDGKGAEMTGLPCVTSHGDWGRWHRRCLFDSSSGKFECEMVCLPLASYPPPQCSGSC